MLKNLPGVFYEPLYVLGVGMLTLVILFFFLRKNREVEVISPAQSSKWEVRFSFLVAVIAALFVGLRPNDPCFVDSQIYIGYYNQLRGADVSFDFGVRNLIFDNMLALMAAQNWSWRVFILLVATLYFVGIWFACRKLFPKHVLISYLVYLGALCTFAYGTNTLKSGVAASIFLMAVAYKDKLVWAGLLLWASLGFHHSMVLPIGAFICAYFYRDTRVYIFIWFTSLVFSLVDVPFIREFLSNFVSTQGSSYLLSTGRDWGGKIGFRYDFVLYSLPPILVAMWANLKQRGISSTYQFIMSIYLIANSVWMLCMYVNFTDRIAYLSWLLYPVVLIYPFLYGNFKHKYRALTIVAVLHLAFTCFMVYRDYQAVLNVMYKYYL